MDWNDLKDRYKPLNQHVSLSADKKQLIRERLHAAMNDVEQPTPGQDHRERQGHPERHGHRSRRYRRVVTIGSLGAGLAAVLCIAAVLDATHQPGSHGPAASGTSTSSTSTSSTSSASGSSASQGPAQFSAAGGTSEAGPNQGVTNGLAVVASSAATLNADTPLKMYGEDGWLFTQKSLLHTADGGKHWTVVHIPPIPSTSSTPYNEVVSVLDGVSARVAIGIVSQSHASITVFRTEDSGSTWQSSQLSESMAEQSRGQVRGQVPASVTFTGDANGWMTTSVPHLGLGGTSPGALYRTTNGAQTWEKVSPTGFPKGTVAFKWLSFVTPQIGFTIGAPQVNADAGVTTGQYRLYRTTDGGRSWQQPSISVPSAGRVNISQVQFTGSTGYLPVVVPGKSQSTLEIYKTTDFGSTWTMSYRIEGQNTGGLVMSVNPESVWLSFGGAVWISRDGAASFERVGTGPTGHITELDMQTSKAGYAVTVTPGPGGTAGETHTVYHTVDGGKSWSEVTKQP